MKILKGVAFDGRFLRGTLLAEFEPLVSGENVVWLVRAKLEESNLAGRPQKPSERRSFYQFSLGNDFIGEMLNLHSAMEGMK